MRFRNFQFASLIAIAVVSFGQTASAHLPYVVPFQFNTGQDVATLYAGSADRYFEPEIAGGNTNNGFYDFTVTDPSGKTAPIRDLSRHKQLTLVEIETNKPGTYKVNRVLIARLPNVIGEGNKALRVVSADLKERLEKHKIKDGKRQFFFEDEAGAAKPTEVQYINNVTTFVTRDKPNDAALKPTATGFELDYKVHPNKVSTRTGLQFVALLDGKTLPDVAFDLYGKGDGKPARTVTSDKAGLVDVRFDRPGIYVLKAWSPGEDVKDGKIVEKKYALWLIFEVTE